MMCECVCGGGGGVFPQKVQRVVEESLPVTSQHHKIMQDHKCLAVCVGVGGYVWCVCDVCVCVWGGGGEEGSCMYVSVMWGGEGGRYLLSGFIPFCFNLVCNTSS